MGVIRWACRSCFACTFCSSGFNLSDPGAGDALYESAVLRRFAGVDLGLAAAPDETTILRFRRLLETHELCGQILDTVNLYLASKGLRISTGTIVDAKLIAAPSSTKNAKERDPEMSRTKKGNQWYFRRVVRGFSQVAVEKAVLAHYALLRVHADVVSCCQQALARFQTETGWKRELGDYASIENLSLPDASFSLPNPGTYGVEQTPVSGSLTNSYGQRWKFS